MATTIVVDPQADQAAAEAVVLSATDVPDMVVGLDNGAARAGRPERLDEVGACLQTPLVEDGYAIAHAPGHTNLSDGMDTFPRRRLRPGGTGRHRDVVHLADRGARPPCSPAASSSGRSIGCRPKRRTGDHEVGRERGHPEDIGFLWDTCGSPHQRRDRPRSRDLHIGLSTG